MRRCFGFTLTELLVTIGIFVLVLGGAGVSFRQASLRRSVTDAAESLRQAILEVQGQALAPTAEKVPGIEGYAFTLLSETDWEIREVTRSFRTTADGVTNLSFGNSLKRGHVPAGVIYRSEPVIEWIGFLIVPTGEIIAGPNFDDDLTAGIDLVVERPDIGRTVRLHFDDETGLIDLVLDGATRSEG